MRLDTDRCGRAETGVGPRAGGPTAEAALGAALEALLLALAPLQVVADVAGGYVQRPRHLRRVALAAVVTT
jgi:hypothetical protein